MRAREFAIDKDGKEGTGREEVRCWLFRRKDAK